MAKKKVWLAPLGITCKYDGFFMCKCRLCQIVIRLLYIIIPNLENSIFRTQKVALSRLPSLIVRRTPHFSQRHTKEAKDQICPMTHDRL